MRWSSSFEVMLRYVQLCVCLPELESKYVDLIMLITSENSQINLDLRLINNVELIEEKL